MWLPAPSDASVRVARPLASSVAVFPPTPSTEKETEPVGVPLPGACGATAAVTVTDWP